MHESPVLEKARALEPAVIEFITDYEIGPNTGIDVGRYRKVDGYRHVNFFVTFTQMTGDEPPVNLGFIFAFDEHGKMGARRFVNIAQNVPAQQMPQFIEVSGAGSWHGAPHNVSSYAVRTPVMAPYVQVFAYNEANAPRLVSVWGYATV